MFNGGRSEGARVGCSMEGGLRVQGLVVQRREVGDQLEQIRNSCFGYTTPEPKEGDLTVHVHVASISDKWSKSNGAG